MEIVIKVVAAVDAIAAGVVVIVVIVVIAVVVAVERCLKEMQFKWNSVYAFVLLPAAVLLAFVIH